MTKHHATVFAPSLERTGHALYSHASRWLLAGSVLALTACTSTPLPEWTPRSTAPVSTSTPAPTATAPDAPVISVAPIASNTHVQALPYSASVAALFPDPAERYSTPGLSDSRLQFTTNSELAELLRELSAASLNGNVRLGLLSSDNAQSGSPIHALVATKGTSISPQALEDSGRPTVMIVAAQQGTDAAATEATLAIAKELGDGGLLAPLLDKINIILVPRANPDGFANGTATTADGTDLTQDHLALQTPEARFLAKLARDYHPSVMLDAGEFAAIEPTRQRFNAVRANDMGLQYAVTPNGHEFITKAAREWVHQPALHALEQAGLRVDWAFEAADENADNGYAMASINPTTLSNASSLKNMASMVTDSRGSDLRRIHVQRRVHGHVQAMNAVLQSAASHADNLKAVDTFVMRDIASQACRGKLTVQAQPTIGQRDITVVDMDTAQLRQQPVVWSDSLQLSQSRARSHACGYWLSADAIPAVERLGMLGVNVQRVAELSSLDAETYQASEANDAVALQRNSFEAPPGSYYVSMNQPLAYLAAAALEPDTPYSFYSAGVLKDLSKVARVVALPQIVFDED